jgi:hypothetical protein
MRRLVDSFLAFIQKWKLNLQRIARATRYDVTVDDLQQDAFLLANEIGNRRGRPIDFSVPADQELVIRAVNLKNVKRGDWHLRKSVRIDYGDEGETPTSILERLAAQASSDPLIALLLKETALDAEAMLANSYSQATAYVMVLVRFNYRKEEVRAYLFISDSTLYKRVAFAADTVRVQPSLFDRIERITNDFMPRRGKGYAVRVEQHSSGTQWAWEF